MSPTTDGCGCHVMSMRCRLSGKVSTTYAPSPKLGALIIRHRLTRANWSFFHTINRHWEVSSVRDLDQRLSEMTGLRAMNLSSNVSYAVDDRWNHQRQMGSCWYGTIIWRVSLPISVSLVIRPLTHLRSSSPSRGAWPSQES